MTEQKTRISDEETKKLQAYILDIMVNIDRVCREHHLRYYLLAGTMLGAVRHKGFVPWDDDADIALPRKDYNILIAHANEWLPKHIELVSGVQNPYYPYAFARIQNAETTYILRRSFNFIGGLPVDIFPLDGMTENPLKRRWHYMRYDFFVRLMYYNLRDPYKHGRGIDCIFIKMCHKLFSSAWLHRKLDKIQSEYDFDSSTLVADHDNAPDRGILAREVYGEPTPITFEGHTFMGVAKPDEYLKYCYGNYMEMPSELPPQNFRFLDLQLPYRSYLKQQNIKSKKEQH